jgi:hypothetical protein
MSLNDDASAQRFFALFRAIKHVAVGNWWIDGCFDFAEIEDELEALVFKSRSVLSDSRGGVAQLLRYTSESVTQRIA